MGRILRESGVQTIELRASIIIGSGSLSFEMIRALVERLPVMVTPRWVRTLAQPIAVEDVIDYLIAALDAPPGRSLILEIGGADRASYGDIMAEYARQRGLHRVMIAVPVLTPRLSSLWLALVTPLYARVGRKLVEKPPQRDDRERQGGFRDVRHPPLRSGRSDPAGVGRRRTRVCGKAPDPRRLDKPAPASL